MSVESHVSRDVRALIVNAHSHVQPDMHSLPLTLKHITILDNFEGAYCEYARLVKVVLQAHGYRMQYRVGDMNVGAIFFERPLDGFTVDFFYGVDAFRLGAVQHLYDMITHSLRGITCVLFPLRFDASVLDLIDAEHLNVVVWRPQTIDECINEATTRVPATYYLLRSADNEAPWDRPLLMRSEPAWVQVTGGTTQDAFYVVHAWAGPLHEEMYYRHDDSSDTDSFSYDSTGFNDEDANDDINEEDDV